MMSCNYRYPTITSGVYNPPVGVTINNMQIPTFSAHVNITVPPEHMKFVIGVQGHYFNAITRCSGALYIWYHKESGIIEVVGFPGGLDDAIKRLKSRMDHISSKAYAIEWPAL